MKPTLKLCSSHSATGISKTPDLVTSLEPVPLLFRARGTTRESLIEGAKQKHTQREGLCDLSIRSRGGGGQDSGAVTRIQWRSLLELKQLRKTYEMSSRRHLG